MTSAIPDNLDDAIDALVRYKRLAPLEADWERVRREFDDGPPTYGRLFDLPHRHRAERIGRARWGDKSLHSEYFANQIFTEFPDARVIHMVRDPRDRYASIANRYEHGSKGIASATGRWLASVRAGEANLSRYPDRYSDRALRGPAGGSRRGDLPDVRVHRRGVRPEMMKMSGAPEHSHGNSSFGDLAPTTISTAPMGRYRTKLRPADIAFIQLVAGGPMRRHGYTIDAVDLHGAERLRFAAVTAPRDSCRLAYWSLHQRRHQTDERPPATRLVDAE